MVDSNERTIALLGGEKFREGASMEPRDVKTVEDAKTIVSDRNLSHIKLGLIDIDGIMRGKYISIDKFFSVLDKGFGFCDVVLGWDSNDQLYDNVTYTGWHTGYPDAPVRVIPESCRPLPDEGGGLFFLCEFAPPTDALCPRGVLRRMLERAENMGMKISSAFEFEFFMFDETPRSVEEKKHTGLAPLTPGNFGYSVLRNSVYSELYQDLLDLCTTMDFPIEGLHTETGPGVLEAALAVDSGIAPADKAALFKTFVKVLAQRNGLMATFMAKWSDDYPGQSGHIHISAQNAKDGTSTFYDGGDANGMSQTMKHFVAGQQKLMGEMLAMVASTVNSYSRLVPGFWAPVNSTWGVENRTCALRVIPGSASSQRVEYRIAAADVNPYLALAAALGSGLYGIEHKLELPDAVTGNAYDQKHAPETLLPATLWEAAQAFKQSQAAKDLFGESFVSHFAATREWEEREYRRHVTDWELKRYFEII
jgi:glutamine synthetase